jgi:hypothetical protein
MRTKAEAAHPTILRRDRSSPFSTAVPAIHRPGRLARVGTPCPPRRSRGRGRHPARPGAGPGPAAADFRCRRRVAAQVRCSGMPRPPPGDAERRRRARLPRMDRMAVAGAAGARHALPSPAHGCGWLAGPPDRCRRCRAGPARNPASRGPSAASLRPGGHGPPPDARRRRASGAGQGHAPRPGRTKAAHEGECSVEISPSPTVPAVPQPLPRGARRAHPGRGT